MSRRLLLASCFAVISTLVLAACGGDGDETATVEEVIETSVTSTDPADCKKLQTLKFMEQVSREHGSAAVAECEKETENGENAKSARVSGVEIDGSDASGEVTPKGNSLDGQTLEVALVKEDDQWKLNEVVKLTDFDQAKLVEHFEREFKESSGIPDRIANCFIKALGNGSQNEVEELLFGDSSKILGKVFESC